MDDFIFDPENEKGSANFDPIPPGDYVAHVTEATVSEMKSGNGTSLHARYQIIEGEHENRLVFQNITFIHRTSEKAQSFGRRVIKDMCDAMGITKAVTDPTVFQFVPVKIRVGIEVDKDGVHPDKNVVKRVMALDGEAGGRAAPANPPSPKPAPAPVASAAAGSGPSGSAPWRR